MAAARAFFGPRKTIDETLADPSITLSYALAGLVCALAALCYAELAAMVPVAGSACTYTFATLGQLIAFIIGWDLVLESRSVPRRSRSGSPAT